MTHPTPAPPAELGRVDGLAYSLFLPEEEPWAGMVVIHGAGSCKENHHDMARAARASGMAAVCLDLRGHGESEGELDARVLDDLAAVADKLPAGLPRVVRGSSMGGFLSIVAAERLGVAAIVAVCPAGSEMLARGLRNEEFEFRVDRESMLAFVSEHDPLDAVAQSAVPLLLLHAEGDERVPYQHSVALHEASRAANKRLVVLPGGHHRSIQHDPELQGESIRFIRRALSVA